MLGRTRKVIGKIIKGVFLSISGLPSLKVSALTIPFKYHSSHNSSPRTTIPKKLLSQQI